MKQQKNSLVRIKTGEGTGSTRPATAKDGIFVAGEDLHQRLLRISLWDSLNKDRKQPISFAFKAKASDVMNRVLAVEYLLQRRAADR